MVSLVPSGPAKKVLRITEHLEPPPGDLRANETISSTMLAGKVTFTLPPGGAVQTWAQGPFKDSDLTLPPGYESWSPYGEKHWWRIIGDEWQQVDAGDSLIRNVIAIHGEANLGIHVPRLPVLEQAWQQYFMYKAVRDFRSLVTPVECRIYQEYDLHAIADYRFSLQSGNNPVWLLPMRNSRSMWWRCLTKKDKPLPPGVHEAKRPSQPSRTAITFQ